MRRIYYFMDEKHCLICLSPISQIRLNPITTKTKVPIKIWAFESAIKFNCG